MLGLDSCGVDLEYKQVVCGSTGWSVALQLRGLAPGCSGRMVLGLGGCGGDLECKQVICGSTEWLISMQLRGLTPGCSRGLELGFGSCGRNMSCIRVITEWYIALQLCGLAPPLDCHRLVLVMKEASFFEMRAAPSRVGWMPSLLIRPALLQNVGQWSAKPTSFSGHHFVSQSRNEDIRLYMSSLVWSGRGPEKTTESAMVLASEHSDSTPTFVTSDWRRLVSFPPAWMMILLYLRFVFASSLRWFSMSPVLAPGMHLMMVAGVLVSTFLTMELPIIRVGLGLGLGLASGE